MRGVWSVALALTLLVQHNTLCQAQKSQECHLSREEVRALVEPSSRTWTVTDATLGNYDIQEVVNCTEEGDTISVVATNRLRPQNRVVITRQLTIEGAKNASGNSVTAGKASMTCPDKDGLFLIQGAPVSFKNLIIEECHLDKRDDVLAIVEIDLCRPRSIRPSAIRMHGVDFVKNANLGGSVGLVVRKPSCYAVEMRDVQFRSNQRRLSSELADVNDLKDIRLVKNDLAGGAGEMEPLLFFPPNSKTTVTSLSASDNVGCVLRVKNAFLNISDSTFFDNHGPEWGVLVALVSNVSVSNSFFDSNTCGGDGAAIVLLGGSQGTFSFVRFFNGSASNGGAVFLRDPSFVRFLNCIFETNTAQRRGGALSVTSTGLFVGRRYLNFFNCTFDSNAGQYGGGIWINKWDDGRAVTYLSHFSKNKASEYGGAIFVGRSWDFVFNVISSMFNFNLGGMGGAVAFYNFQGEIDFHSNGFVGNAASDAGNAIAFYNDDDKGKLFDVFIRGSFFDGNKGKEMIKGGAVYALVGDIRLHLIQSRFFENRAAWGGALFLIHFQSAFIEDCTFEKNRADLDGGAFMIPEDESYYSYGIVDVRHCSFVKNKAGGFGGAVASDLGEFTFTECLFERNEANTKGGAAVMGFGGALFVNSSFIKNKAKAGGALYLKGPNAIANSTACIFQENIAELYGGAVYLMESTSGIDLHLHRSTLVRNRAKIGGGGFFQIDHKDVEQPDVEIERTSFVGNHADRAGGAYFITKIEALSSDCNITPSVSDVARHDHASKEFDCGWFVNNSVGKDGYGANIGTEAEFFTLEVEYKNGTVYFLDEARTYSIDNWKSGDDLPQFKVVMLDGLFQRKAATRSARQPRGAHGYLWYDDFAKATIESPDQLIPNPLVADVHNGSGKIIVGGPLKRPGNYSLVLWIADARSDSITISVTLRECIVNEESRLLGTLCAECDANQFNFHPENRSCASCPDHCACANWGLVPDEHYWIPSPCHPKVKECLSDTACHYDDRALRLNRFYNDVDVSSCQLNATELDKFNDLQCNKGHAGYLCGSCSERFGQFRLACYQCSSKGVVILWLFVMAAWLFVVSFLAVVGNLQDTQTPDIPDEASMRLAIEAPSNPLHQPGAGPPSEAAIEIAKRNVNESVKLFLNFSQVNSMAMMINTRWTGLIRRTLKALNVLGAVSVDTTFSLDCLFPKDARVPRSISRVIISLLLPFGVLAIGAGCWYLAIPNDPLLLQRRLVLSIVVVFYISYIGWVEHLSSAFSCVMIEAGLTEDNASRRVYWTEDTSVECFRDSHAVFVGVVVIPMILLILIGFPVGSAIYLYHKRKNEELESESVKEKFGFMYSAYKTRCVFWDCLILLRKGALTLILVFGASVGSNVQGLTAACVLMLFQYLQTRFMPFHDDYKTMNSLEIFSLLVCIFTFMSGLYFNDPSVTEAGRMLVSVLTLALISGFILYFVYDLYWKAVKYCRLRLLSIGVPIKAEDSSLEIIYLWLRRQFKRLKLND